MRTFHEATEKEIEHYKELKNIAYSMYSFSTYTTKDGTRYTAKEAQALIVNVEFPRN